MAFDFKRAPATERSAEYKRMAKEIGDDQFFTKKELDHLPDILLDGECVLAFTSGMMDGNTWLIALTDKRVIFLDKGMIYGLKQVVIDLDKINAVSGETGLLLGSISIQDGATTHTIKNVPKKAVVNFTNKVRDAIETRKRGQVVHLANQQSSVDIDVISQLERLAALKEKGVLTQEEFDQHKAKLTQTNSDTAPVFNVAPEPVIQTSHVVKGATNQTNEMPRRVGIPLGIGIVFMPLIFSWLTLRKGYTTIARVMALGWLALTLIVAFSGGSDTQPNTAGSPPLTSVENLPSTQAIDPIVKSSKWYEGGTLHKANALQWQKAEKADKIATCADLIATLHANNSFKSELQQSIRNVDDVKPWAEELTKALDEAFKVNPDPKTNESLFINQKVSDTAVLLMTVTGWLK